MQQNGHNSAAHHTRATFLRFSAPFAACEQASCTLSHLFASASHSLIQPCMAPLPPLVAAFLYVAFGTIASAVPALHSGATTFILGAVIAFITGSSTASSDILVASVTHWLTSSTAIASMLLIPPLIQMRLVALALPSPFILSVSASVVSRACNGIICTAPTCCCTTNTPSHLLSGAANFAASCAVLGAMLRAFSSDWSWQQSIAVAAALCAGNRRVHVPSASSSTQHPSHLQPFLLNFSIIPFQRVLDHSLPRL